MPAVGKPATTAVLTQLREEFPQFHNWVEITGEHSRFDARRLRHGATPHTLVTDDAAELRAVLSGQQPDMFQP
ncbi:MAG TPA: hypothetical protein VMV92_31630 [Streptosporangiaceae bacterium]|nr:hypothetical protein [Streptosporangiaceae bacterium]HUZ22767.1 hypothetical protein [Streptosporangiaceae bacterium]